MKPFAPACAIPLLLLSSFAMSQESDAFLEDPGVPIETLIAPIAEQMDREFVIDPRIRGIRAITTRDNVDYDSLLGILRIHNAVAIATGDQIHVMPEQNMRHAATRILQEDDSSVSDHEVVTRIVAIPQLPEEFGRPAQGGEADTNPFAPAAATTAMMLVPVLRPMMSQPAQLGAVPGTNILIMVDRYDNIRRITAVIDEIVEASDD